MASPASVGTISPGPADRKTPSIHEQGKEALRMPAPTGAAPAAAAPLSGRVTPARPTLDTFMEGLMSGDYATPLMRFYFETWKVLLRETSHDKRITVNGMIERADHALSNDQREISDSPFIKKGEEIPEEQMNKVLSYGGLAKTDLKRPREELSERAVFLVLWAATFARCGIDLNSAKVEAFFESVTSHSDWRAIPFYEPAAAPAEAISNNVRERGERRTSGCPTRLFFRTILPVAVVGAAVACWSFTQK